mgnify:CR=1 FL=1
MPPEATSLILTTDTLLEQGISGIPSQHRYYNEPVNEDQTNYTSYSPLCPERGR